jgi:H+/gluconate symporter-like permease
MRRPLGERSIFAAMAKPAHSTHPPTPIRVLNVATLAVFVGWLAAAAYALAYLVSH